MKFGVSSIRLLNFTGWSHLQNHINYLCRTDAGQKWTNRYTEGNLVIVGESVSAVGKNLKERKETAKTVRNIIRDNEAHYDELRMCCVERQAYSGDGSLSVGDVIDAVQYLAGALEERGMRILFAVVHLDQGDPHIHLVIYDPQ